MDILVTGSAGFIGYHVTEALLRRGHRVSGVDNLNDYYDPNLKESRLNQLAGRERFTFHELDLAHGPDADSLFQHGRFDIVIHLAAQVGVRHSFENPRAYTEANLVAFSNVLEGCRVSGTRRLLYASSSSVYGRDAELPFSEGDRTDNPLSLYAATKMANELMACAYWNMFGMHCLGLRFFTVYGPWGRPDMAVYKFARAIANGEEIDVFGQGSMSRDFTYIDDVVEGILALLDNLPEGHTILNIGNNKPVSVLNLVRILEDVIGKKAKMRLLPMQPGDAPDTCADITAMQKDHAFRPQTTLAEGVRKFFEWYQSYHTT